MINAGSLSSFVYPMKNNKKVYFVVSDYCLRFPCMVTIVIVKVEKHLRYIKQRPWHWMCMLSSYLKVVFGHILQYRFGLYTSLTITLVLYIYIQLRSVRGANKNSLSKVDNNEKQVSVHLIGLCIITRGCVAHLLDQPETRISCGGQGC